VDLERRYRSAVAQGSETGGGRRAYRGVRVVESVLEQRARAGSVGPAESERSAHAYAEVVTGLDVAGSVGRILRGGVAG
jgi:hypothetical protein